MDALRRCCAWEGSEGGRLRLEILDEQGQEVRTLWEGPDAYLNFPSMDPTPDGRHVLLSTFLKTGEFVLRSIATDTGELTEIYRSPDDDPAGAMRNIAVHPDGVRIAFSRGVGKGEIWVMEGLR